MRNNSSNFLFGIDEFGSNVTINWRDEPLDEFDIYAGAYHRAAENLMSDLLSKSGFHDIDSCPIVFLYRHSIELYLKAICLCGYKLFQLLNKKLLLHGNDLEQEKLFNNHKLVPLIEVVKQISDELKCVWDLEDNFNYFKSYENFKSVISEIDEIDSGSFAFRYPYDKQKETASLTKDFSFNLALFQEKINLVISALDGMSSQLKVELELASVQAYSQQQEE